MKIITKTFLSRFLVLLMLFSFFNKQSLFAQTGTSVSGLSYSPLTTAVPFVGYIDMAKTGGYGNVILAAPASVMSTFGNMAKIINIEPKLSAGLNYTPLLPNLQLENYALTSFAATYKLKENHAVAFYGKYLNYPQITATNRTGDIIGNYKPVEFLIGGGYATKLNRYLSLGVSAKYIYSNIGYNHSTVEGSDFQLSPASTFAIDFGLDYQREIRDGLEINAGVAISNLGNKINYTNDGRYQFLPANLALGFGINKVYTKQHSINAGIEITKLLVPSQPTDTVGGKLNDYYNQSVFSSWFKSFYDAKGGFAEEMKEIMVKLGVEYNFKNLLFTKVGYIYQNALKGNGSVFTIGFSVRFNTIDLDLAYGIPTYNDGTNNTSPLANSFRLGVVYNLNDE